MAIPTSDRWYAAEVVPANLEKLRQAVIKAFKLTPAAVGTKGNPKTHFRGYHRSRNFCLLSPHSTSRTYSVQAAVNKGGDGNWISAIDISLSQAQMIAVSRRLDAACRAGRLEKVVEWYGTFDGKVVVGWDNIENHADSSDGSHLWHIHISLARSRANDNHDDLLAVLVGQGSGEEDMGALDELVVIDQDIDNLTGGYVKAGQKIPLRRFIQLDFVTGHRDFNTGQAVRNALTVMAASVDTIKVGIGELKELLAEAGGNPDIAAFIAKLEEEANKTRAFAQDLMDKDEAQEAAHAAKMAEAWKASVIE